MVAGINNDDNIPQEQSTTRENVHFILNKLKDVQNLGHGKRISLGMNEVSYICDMYLKYAKTESPLIDINFEGNSFAIIGDIHGQYNDIWKIVNEAYVYGTKHKKNMRYLFLGDYVDRGQNSLETIMLLMCWKILDPTEVYLLRGNHECRMVNCRYGFLDEMKSRFQPEAVARKLFDYMNLCFDHMPIAAVLEEKYFCVHGGISPKLTNLDQIKQLKFPIDGDSNKLVNDLLWADPCPKVKEFDANPNRGPKFGEEAVDKFFSANPGIVRILRAHQFLSTGVEYNFSRKVATIFSAPNYRQSKNFGGILMIQPDMTEDIIYIEPNLH